MFASSSKLGRGASASRAAVVIVPVALRYSSVDIVSLLFFCTLVPLLRRSPWPTRELLTAKSWSEAFAVEVVRVPLSKRAHNRNVWLAARAPDTAHAWTELSCAGLGVVVKEARERQWSRGASTGREYQVAVTRRSSWEPCCAPFDCLVTLATAFIPSRSRHEQPGHLRLSPGVGHGEPDLSRRLQP